MFATVLHGPGDVRYEQVEDPKILKPTDAIIKLSATCICGSDLWPYRGLSPREGPAHMGHEYCGVVVEVGQEVRAIRPGQFVVGSFCLSDNTCPHCQFGFQSSSSVSNASPGFAHARSGLACTQGARVIDSTPPATMSSASPARIA